jgi:hypothetical protein
MYFIWCVYFSCGTCIGNIKDVTGFWALAAKKDTEGKTNRAYKERQRKLDRIPEPPEDGGRQLYKKFLNENPMPKDNEDRKKWAVKYAKYAVRKNFASFLERTLASAYTPSDDEEEDENMKKFEHNDYGERAVLEDIIENRGIPSRLKE